MQLHHCDAANATLSTLMQCGLVTAREVAAVSDLARHGAPYAADVELADTIHLHIKVDDTSQLPNSRFVDAGACLDREQEGFVKYRFPGAINAIFSHIKVSQDELLETACNRRSRPFLDHIGIDMRAETAPVRQAFDALPNIAQTLHWSHAAQGGPASPVYCCHVEVAEKHWLYPPDENGHPGIPLEFAYGALKVNPEQMGCDLRPANPANPAKIDPASIPCCSAAKPTVAAACS